MLFIRQSRRSIWRTVSDLLQNTAVWNPPFTVYREGDMALPASSLVRPYVFLMDSRKSAQNKHLPILFIENTARVIEYELGAATRAVIDFQIHVIGRSRAEKDDLAASIMANVTEVAVRDFDAIGEPLLYTAELIPVGGQVWAQANVPVTTQQEQGGYTEQWTALSSRFIVTK